MFIKKQGERTMGMIRIRNSLPLKKRRSEKTIMFNCISLPLKKRISCRWRRDSKEELITTADEYEVCDALLSLKTATFNVNLNGGDENHLLDLPPLDSLRDYIDVCSKSFEKKLSRSDLNTNQNRLFLNKKNVTKCILPMLREGEDAKVGVPVTAYDMFGNKFNMVFKMWSKKFYVLSGAGWNTFFKTHALKKENLITVWVFRHLVTNNLALLLGSQGMMEMN